MVAKVEIKGKDKVTGIYILIFPSMSEVNTGGWDNHAIRF
jgi:hypothetical protein